MEKTAYQLAEIEISYKPAFKAANRPQIDCAGSAYQIMLENWSEDRIELLEEFKVLLLNRRNRVLGIVNLSQGGLSGTIADAKVIFAIALKACASSILLSHNHPSGEASPSQADISLTKRLVEAGKLLDIQVLDHIILCRDSYFSFKDENLM